MQSKKCRDMQDKAAAANTSARQTVQREMSWSRIFEKSSPEAFVILRRIPVCKPDRTNDLPTKRNDLPTNKNTKSNKTNKQQKQLENTSNTIWQSSLVVCMGCIKSYGQKSLWGKMPRLTTAVYCQRFNSRAKL